MTPRLRPVAPDDETRAVAARIAALRTAYLECRTLGHSWRITFIGPIGRGDADLQNRARRSIFDPDGARVLRCTRCRTERIDLCIVGYGRQTYSYMLTGRSYRYPDEYAVEGAMAHRDLLQHELFHRERDDT